MSEAPVPTPHPHAPLWRRHRPGRLRVPRGAIAPRPRADLDHPKRIRLWLPLTPLWMLLAPFALLLAPLVAFAPRLLPDNPRAQAARGAVVVRPYRAAFALGAVLLAMSGTVVEVDAPGAEIRIRIL